MFVIWSRESMNRSCSSISLPPVRSWLEPFPAHRCRSRIISVSDKHSSVKGGKLRRRGIISPRWRFLRPALRPSDLLSGTLFAADRRESVKRQWRPTWAAQEAETLRLGLWGMLVCGSNEYPEPTSCTSTLECVSPCVRVCVWTHHLSCSRYSRPNNHPRLDAHMQSPPHAPAPEQKGKHEWEKALFFLYLLIYLFVFLPLVWELRAAAVWLQSCWRHFWRRSLSPGLSPRRNNVLHSEPLTREAEQCFIYIYTVHIHKAVQLALQSTACRYGFFLSSQLKVKSQSQGLT